MKKQNPALRLLLLTVHLLALPYVGRAILIVLLMLFLVRLKLLKKVATLILILIFIYLLLRNKKRKQTTSQKRESNNNGNCKIYHQYLESQRLKKEQAQNYLSLLTRNDTPITKVYRIFLPSQLIQLPQRTGIKTVDQNVLVDFFPKVVITTTHILVQGTIEDREYWLKNEKKERNEYKQPELPLRSQVRPKRGLQVGTVMERLLFLWYVAPRPQQTKQVEGSIEHQYEPPTFVPLRLEAPKQKRQKRRRPYWILALLLLLALLLGTLLSPIATAPSIKKQMPKPIHVFSPCSNSNDLKKLTTSMEIATQVQLVQTDVNVGKCSFWVKNQDSILSPDPKLENTFIFVQRGFNEKGEPYFDGLPDNHWEITPRNANEKVLLVIPENFRSLSKREEMSLVVEEFKKNNPSTEVNPHYDELN